jgi:pimeloyl-ACP methyl ester carboxylesterase
VKDATCQTLSLRSGRRLAYAEYGVPDGLPLFYCHGTPGSRLECPFDEALLKQLSIRLIAPERPGYGLSDFQEGRRLLDWPADIAQLADALGLEQFAVLGFSGGGPYALACAHELGDRITATGLMGCLASLDAPGMMSAVSPAFRSLHELAANDPVQLEEQLAPAAASPTALLAIIEESIPTTDKTIFADPAFRAMYLANLSESMRQGAKGSAWDLHLVDRPWGFKLTHIEKPIWLWHGCDDANVSVTMGRYLAQTLPRCTANFLEGEGHYSLFRHGEAVLRELMAR